PVLARAYEAAGIAPARARELAEAAQRLYVDPASWTLFEDTAPALERLGAALSCSAETGFEKPHPQAFAAVLDELGPEEAWMIGDNVVADVLGAETAGIPAILVRRPDSRAARY